MDACMGACMDRQTGIIVMVVMVRQIANATMPSRFLWVPHWLFLRWSCRGGFLLRVPWLSVSGIHLNTGVLLV